MPLPLNQNYGAWKTQDHLKDNAWENKKGKGKSKNKGKGSSMAPRGMVQGAQHLFQLQSIRMQRCC